MIKVTLDQWPGKVNIEIDETMWTPVYTAEDLEGGDVDDAKPEDYLTLMEGFGVRHPDAGMPALVFAGVPFHVHAIRMIREGGDDLGDWVVANDEHDADYESYVAINGDGPLRRTTINGNEYVIVLVPFSD